jgi:PIN domain-containing protein
MATPGPAIYLETSAARAAGWPHVSASIERLAVLARGLHAEVFLPELVEIELEEGWLRDAADKAQALASRVKELERQLSGIIDRGVTTDVAAPDRLRENYRRAAETVKQTLQARATPTTARPVRDFAAMAVRRQPPFKERDQGFRDAVIFWSILDHAVELGKRPSILIAQDECFSNPHLIGTAKEAGIRLHLYRTVRDFIDEVHNRLGAALRQSVEEDQERARRALLQIREAVEAFITENLIFHEYELGIFLGTARGINRIAVTDIRNVRTSLDVPLPTTEAEVKISFEAVVDVHAIVERYAIPAPRAVRVGEELPPAEVASIGAVLAGPQRSEETLPKTVEVEATAVRTEAGDYINIRLESVRLQSGLLGLGR